MSNQWGLSLSTVEAIERRGYQKNKLIDATNGRKMRAVLVTDPDHVAVSSLQPETIIQRIKNDKQPQK
ncbi:MAG: extracellular matrix/biofilm biosynthesis regulator RemA family protein [Candidatus Omnitrophota bacterium]